MFLERCLSSLAIVVFLFLLSQQRRWLALPTELKLDSSILRDGNTNDHTTHHTQQQHAAKRQLLHQLNGPARGRPLTAGANRSLGFNHHRLWWRRWRRWRNYYLVSPRGLVDEWCDCFIDCNRNKDTVHLYMTTLEPYLMHDDWSGWSLDNSLTCVSDATGPNQTTCRINTFQIVPWYCYIAVNVPSGRTEGDCVINCDFRL